MKQILVGVLFISLLSTQAVAQEREDERVLDQLRRGAGDEAATPAPSVAPVSQSTLQQIDVASDVEMSCDNHEDDDADGLIDCSDPDCRGSTACKVESEETPAPSRPEAPEGRPERSEGPPASQSQTSSTPAQPTANRPPPRESAQRSNPPVTQRRPAESPSSAYVLRPGDPGFCAAVEGCGGEEEIEAERVREIVSDMAAKGWTRATLREIAFLLSNLPDPDKIAEDPDLRDIYLELLDKYPVLFNHQMRIKELEKMIGKLFDSSVDGSPAATSQAALDAVETLEDSLEAVDPQKIADDARAAATAAAEEAMREVKDDVAKLMKGSGDQFIIQLGVGGGYGLNYLTTWQDEAGLVYFPRSDDRYGFLRSDLLFFRAYDNFQHHGGLSARFGIGSNLGLAALWGAGVMWQGSRPGPVSRRLFVGPYVGYVGGSGGIEEGFGGVTYNAHGFEVAIDLGWLLPFNKAGLAPDLALDLRVAFRDVWVDDAAPDGLWQSPGFSVEVAFLGGLPSARKLSD